MATHSSTLAWKIPWAEEPGWLQSMGSLRVGPEWATSLSLFTFMLGEGNGNPLQGSCLENPRDGGAWWAAVYGVAQSWTQLKWLSSSSSTLITYFKCVTYQQDWFSSLLLTKIKIKIKPVSKMVNQWNEMCESIMGDYVRYYSCHQILWNASF